MNPVIKIHKVFNFQNVRTNLIDSLHTLRKLGAKGFKVNLNDIQKTKNIKNLDLKENITSIIQYYLIL